MAMSVVYTTVAGRIVHENRGGVERFYGQDPLGSTAALYDASGNKTDEWFYWPYGEIRSHTGSSITPFTFVGTLGYYTDLPGQLYVRARILMTILAMWLTVDPLWPGERAYGYVGERPTWRVDPTGLVCACGVSHDVLAPNAAKASRIEGDSLATSVPLFLSPIDPGSAFVCGNKVPCIPWPLSWICRRYCEACYGLCFTQCSDDGDIVNDLICHAVCAVRYATCKRSKTFPPKF